MKIEKIEIQNFKLFDQFQLELEPDLNVLAGVNGSGKTTLLELLNLAQPIEELEKLQLVEGENLLKLAETLHFEVLFSDGERERLNFQELMLKIEEKGEPGALYFPVHYSPNSEVIQEYLDKLIYEQDVVASKAYQRLREQIEQILEVTGIDLKVEFSRLDRHKRIYFRRKEREFLIEELSSGEKTLIGKGIELLLRDPFNRVILVDEPENSLHPKWQSRILELYQWISREFNAQIVVATHSPFVISSTPDGKLTLLREEEGKIEGIKGPSYGWEIGEILTEIMGVDHLRAWKVAEKFKEVYQLLEEGELEEAERLIRQLEGVVGGDDPEINRLKTQLWFERFG